MKKRQTFIIVISALLILTILGYYEHYSAASCNSDLGPFIDSPLEIEPKFLIMEDQNILFSAASTNGFTLHTFKDGAIKMPNADLQDVITPFILEGKAAGLQDYNGSENFISTIPVLNSLADFKYFRAVFSFKNGYVLIIHLKTNEVHLIDIKKGTKQRLLRNIQKLHNVCFSDDYTNMVINYDNKLIYLGQNRKIIELATGAQGGSMNPFIYNSEVYFANNVDSEFYRLFRIDLKDPLYQRQLMYQSDHDVRMPKFNGTHLYFIEIINGEYLLRRMNSGTRVIQEITQKGVVYNYEFYAKENIIFSYCDFYTPKCLVQYNETEGSFNNLTGSSLKLDLSYELIEKSSFRSQAYIFFFLEPKK